MWCLVDAHSVFVTGSCSLLASSRCSSADCAEACNGAPSEVAGIRQTQAGVMGWETAAEADAESARQDAQCKDL